MSFEIAFVLLFAVATGVAILAQRLKVPYTVALVVAGLLLGTSGFEGPHLTKELLYAIFLPGLLFEAAFHLEFKKFWQNKWAVTSLAIPGLVAAIVLTAVILTPTANALGFVEDFNLIHGLVFAALIAATDPIAVVGLFKTLGVPKRLAVVVEGESLINDGTAVVIFTLLLAIATGENLTIGGAISRFIIVAGAGGIVGLVFGYSVSWLTHKIEDPMVEITLTTIAAYGAFAVAEQFHVSGVIATVVAGMLCGNYGARSGMSPSVKIAVLSFWEYWAFALNSIVFLLIGLEVEPAMLLESWQPICVAFGVVMVARTVVVFGSSSVLRLTKEKMPWSWSAIITWGGLRGSLSMVLVLGLALDFPHRTFLVTMTFGVVVLSILGQGLTIGWLLKKLGVLTGAQHEDYELKRADLRAANAALAEIGVMERKGEMSRELVAELKSGYTQRRDAAESEIEGMHLEQTELREQAYVAAARHLLMAEKQSLLDSHSAGQVSDDVFDELMGGCDARLMALEDRD